MALPPLFWGVGEKLRMKFHGSWRWCFFCGEDLRHPNIVACLGFECTKDSFYIYLEYVPWQNFGCSKVWILGFSVKLLFLNPSTSETLPKWQPIHRNLKSITKQNQLQKSDVSSLAKSFQRLVTHAMGIQLSCFNPQGCLRVA